MSDGGRPTLVGSLSSSLLDENALFTVSKKKTPSKEKNTLSFDGKKSSVCAHKELLEKTLAPPLNDGRRYYFISCASDFEGEATVVETVHKAVSDLIQNEKSWDIVWIKKKTLQQITEKISMSKSLDIEWRSSHEWRGYKARLARPFSSGSRHNVGFYIVNVNSREKIISLLRGNDSVLNDFTSLILGSALNVQMLKV